MGSFGLIEVSVVDWAKVGVGCEGRGVKCDCFSCFYYKAGFGLIGSVIGATTTVDVS